MRFSERIGKRHTKIEFEREAMSDELRNSLWSVVLEFVLNDLSNFSISNNISSSSFSELTIFYRDLWLNFLKKPIDSLSMNNNKTVSKDMTQYNVRQWFYDAEWYDVFDFIEFVSRYNRNFQEACNKYLKTEMAAYRFVDGTLVEINSKEEILEIEYALNNSDQFKSVREHLKQAISLYSDKQKPDFRNSIKESISAVESLAKNISGDDKAALGKALAIIEKKHKIPQSLKLAFNQLYGYTSNEGGIRHGLSDNDIDIDMEEARFMMVTCSAFINYLMNKI